MVGWVALEACRQIRARGNDGGLDVAGRSVDVAAEVELQSDAGLSERALRRHLGNVGNLPKVTLERLGDASGNGFGTGARKRRAHRYGWVVDLRQRSHRQICETKNTREADPKREQRGGHGTANKWSGNIHAHASPCGGRSGKVMSELSAVGPDPIRSHLAKHGLAIKPKFGHDVSRDGQ